ARLDRSGGDVGVEKGRPAHLRRAPSAPRRSRARLVGCAHENTLYYKVLHVKNSVWRSTHVCGSGIGCLRTPEGAGASQDPLGGSTWTVSSYVQFAETCDSFRERRITGVIPVGGY